MSTDEKAPAARPAPGGGSFHARAATAGWGAVLRRRYLGLSLATHVVVIGLTGAVAAVVVGADDSRARGPVAVRVQSVAELPPETNEERSAVPEPEETVFPDPEDVPADAPERFDEPARSDFLDPVLLPDVLPLDATFPSLVIPEPEPAPAPPEPTVPQEAPEPAPEVADVAPEVADAEPEVADVEPVLVAGPPPDYPRRARRAGLEGSVDCLLVVEADGRVSSVRLVRSSGHPLLDEAALAALARWTFRPGLVAGLPGRREVEHRVTFRLDG